MNFQKIIKKIERLSLLDNFSQSANEIEKYINQLNKLELLEVINQIGIIPESIEHDSSVEKLYSKASDSVLSRAFQELGLKSSVLTERADSADVIAKSFYHEYELVADAKAFRLSRTAKNQKDFKVEALSKWRKDSDYSILASPYFQYPNTTSQIYAQALSNNVCLLSWEHLSFLILNNIKEDKNINLSEIWNFSSIHSEKCSVSDSKKCFISDFNLYFCQTIDIEITQFNEHLNNQINVIQDRGCIEKQYWNSEELKIKGYSHKQAIEQLLKTRKIDNKIKQIDKYTKGLKAWPTNS